MHVLRATLLSAVLIASFSSGGEAASWQDPSPHAVRFVTVQPNVRLEVLDWGGKGRPIVLLAGGGNTAHVYDEFALKLRADGHRVYGITRSGYGASGVPDTGYSADRLGDDVIAVIDALGLGDSARDRPVLVGHSFAGQELSSVGTRHPQRIAGLVYLDAKHSYDAVFDAEGLYMIVEWKRQLKELQSRLKSLEEEPFDSRPLARQLLEENIPQIRAILEKLIRIEDGRPPRPPAEPADLQSYTTVRAWYARGAKVFLPESEFRQMLVPTADGHPTMKFRTPNLVEEATQAGRQKFSDLRVPVLGILAAMNDPGSMDSSNPEARANAEAYVWFQTRRAERQAMQLKADAPNAWIVTLQRADHYVFLSNEAEVLAEIRSFVRSL